MQWPGRRDWNQGGGGGSSRKAGGAEAGVAGAGIEGASAAAGGMPVVRSHHDTVVTREAPIPIVTKTKMY